MTQSVSRTRPTALAVWFIIAGAIYLLLAIAVRHVLTWVGPRFLFGASAKAGAR